jgi:hypothetical protein
MTGLVRFCAVLLMVGGSVLPALAQVNTEKMRAADVDGIAVTLGGDFALQSGNADLVEVGASARLDVEQGRHYAFLVGRLRYGRSQEDVYKDRAFSHLRYNYRLTGGLTGEAFVQVEQNAFTLLQLRLLGGSGIRAQYVDTETVRVAQGTTLMAERERLNAERLTRHPARATVVRWSNYLSGRVRLAPIVTLTTTAYLQPRLDAFGDVRILNETVLAVQVTEAVALTTTFDLSYDSRPPAVVEPVDLALRSGVNVEF